MYTKDLNKDNTYENTGLLRVSEEPAVINIDDGGMLQ
jgi:hypothetical protein